VSVLLLSHYVFIYYYYYYYYNLLNVMAFTMFSCSLTWLVQHATECSKQN